LHFPKSFGYFAANKTTGGQKSTSMQICAKIKILDHPILVQFGQIYILHGMGGMLLIYDTEMFVIKKIAQKLP